VADETRLDWDDANAGHVAHHRVTSDEAQQVPINDPLERQPQVIEGEERFPNVGITDRGQWLVIVVTSATTRPA
jgi:hypothetical protein